MPGIFPFTVRWSWKSPRKIGNVMGSHSLAAQIQNLPGLSGLGTFVQVCQASDGTSGRNARTKPSRSSRWTSHGPNSYGAKNCVMCQSIPDRSRLLHHTPPYSTILHPIYPRIIQGSQGSQVLPHLSCKVKSSSSNDATIQAPKLKLLEQPVGIISRGLQIHKGWVPWHEDLRATLVSKSGCPKIQNPNLQWHYKPNIWVV